jgi:hypothetical protein
MNSSPPNKPSILARILKWVIIAAFLILIILIVIGIYALLVRLLTHIFAPIVCALTRLLYSYSGWAYA